MGEEEWKKRSGIEGEVRNGRRGIDEEERKEMSGMERVKRRKRRGVE